MDRRLFVDNLGPATTTEALTELFRTVGNVESVTIPTSQSSSSPNHAFIEMMTDYEAKQAVLLLNDSEWNGLRLTVTHAGPSARRAAGFTGGGVHLTRRKVQKIIFYSSVTIAHAQIAGAPVPAVRKFKRFAAVSRGFQ